MPLAVDGRRGLVRDQGRRAHGPLRLGQFAEEPPEPGTAGGVEVAGGLIGEEDLGVEEEGAGDGDAAAARRRRGRRGGASARSRSRLPRATEEFIAAGAVSCGAGASPRAAGRAARMRSRRAVSVRGSRLNCWKTMPMPAAAEERHGRRRPRGSSDAHAPRSRTSPLVGAVEGPPSRCRSVDLPLPDWPMMA